MTKDKKGNDLRCYPRYEIKGKAKFKTPMQMDISLATIKNISGGGLCILSEKKVDIGSKLSLEFMLPGDKTPIITTSEVRWVEDLDSPIGNYNYRLGVEFRDIKKSQQDKITKFVISRMRAQVTERIGATEEGKKPLTILAVDDDKVTLSTIKAVFDGSFTVLTATDGHAGVEMAREWRPDIILLDIIMPDMDGFSTLMMLKDFPETADIPVIMLSVIREKNKVFQAMQHGAKDYMIKPFTSESLLRKIQTVCEM